MDLKVLKEAIRKEVRRLREAGELFADEPEGGGDQQQAAPAPDQGQQQAPAAPDNKVSLGKVAGSPEGGQGVPEEITLDTVIEKLNSIRSGKSFKDDEVMAQMEKYYDDLKDAEKKALQAFLTGISQIVTAGVPGEQAPEPEEAPTNVQMIDKEKVKTKEIKPNIIKKGGQGTAGKPSPENTASPISVKQR